MTLEAPEALTVRVRRVALPITDLAPAILLSTISPNLAGEYCDFHHI